MIYIKTDQFAATRVGQPIFQCPKFLSKCSRTQLYMELNKRSKLFIKDTDKRHNVMGINVSAKKPQKV